MESATAVFASSSLSYATCKSLHRPENLNIGLDCPVRGLPALKSVKCRSRPCSSSSSSSYFSSYSSQCTRRSLFPSMRTASHSRPNVAVAPSVASLTEGKALKGDKSLSPSLFLSGQRLLPVGLGPVSLMTMRRKKAGDGLSETVCKAYESAADANGVIDSALDDSTSSTVPPAAVPAKEGASPLRLAVIFGLWYAFNVVFNIYNKKVLNVYPFPWLTSTFSLLAGTLFMLGAWATKAQPVPPLSKEFMMALAPVALFHTIGHVAATVSMSKVAVSFTHIIKSSEPVFSVLVSSLFLGEHFALPVYLSLLPIVIGCSIAALTELTFNAAGFWGAMISNIAFVFRNVFSKRGLNKFKEIDGINLYAIICILSLVYLTPLAFYVEGPAAWSAGWNSAAAQIGAQQLGWWIFLQSLFYHLYNQVSYMALDNISPLTFSVGNTMKRVVVIIASIIAFNTKVSPLNALGSAIAIFGTFLYSQAKALSDKKTK